MSDDCSILLDKLQPRRLLTELLAESLMRIGETDRAWRVAECGTFVEVTSVSGDEKITAANFCRERLCPNCNWRRSARIYGNVSRILDYLDEHGAITRKTLRRKSGNLKVEERHKLKYLFLTLTVRNCPFDGLTRTLDEMQEAFHRLVNNTTFRRRVLGYMRTLEITINWEQYTLHPHYHLILAVDKAYASKGDDTYWTHDDWRGAWQQAARLDYKPQVSIEAVKGRRQGIAEMSKYLAKATDYIDPGDPDRTDLAVTVLLNQIAGRQLVSYGGCMAAAQRALKLEDPETGPLVDMVRGDVACVVRRYHWASGLSRYVEDKSMREEV